MAFIKCPSCGKEIQQNSSKCMYCDFDMTNYDRDTKIKLVVQEPNVLPLGSSSLSIYNKKTDEWIADVKLGDMFYLNIQEPTAIAVKKTAWKTGHITLRAKPNATYKIMLKTGFLTSKIVIKDISDSPAEVVDELTTEPKEEK